MSAEEMAVQFAEQQEIIRSFTRFFIFVDILVFAVLIAVAILGIKFLKSQKRLKASNEYLRYMIAGQESERARIARELHDTVAQDICYCKKLSEGGAKNSELSELLSKSIFQIRDLCYNLAPPDITKNDFTANITSLCAQVQKQMETATGRKTDFHITIGKKLDTSFLTAEENMNLYRIVQESLANITKHANAQEVSVLLRNENEDEKPGLYIFVTDDGKGFEPQSAEQKSRTFGLSGMRQRATLIGAEVTVDSHIGEGTQVEIIKPAGGTAKNLGGGY